MSSTALPISNPRFAAALTDLPISALHAKIAELRNSIAHLAKSNAELEDYVRRENDKDCYEALMENKEVIARFEERIALVKREIVEVRGLGMPTEEGSGGSGERSVDVDVDVDGDVDGDGGQAREGGDTGGGDANESARGVNGDTGAQASTQTQGGEQRNGTSGAGEEEGVFL